MLVPAWHRGPALAALLVLWAISVAGSDIAHRVLKARRQLRPCLLLDKHSDITPNNFSISDVKFIHIPKTGGTSVEDLSLRLGARWGRHARPEFRRNSDASTVEQLCRCNLYHRVPRCVPGYYDGEVTFAVVRHPTLRFMSEYCWRNSFRTWRLSASQLIEVMERTIARMANGTLASNANDCHLIPQTLYTESADFVLYFEELDQDFQCFGKLLLGQDVQLPHSNPSTSFCRDAHLSFRNLSATRLQQLEDYYAQDFVQYGYRRFSEPSMLPLL